jgi:hypothetical protein
MGMNEKVTDPTYKEDFGRTICEVHREIYDMLYEERLKLTAYDDIIDKLQESFTYAKKMDAKLRQYKNNYDEDWWEKERQEVVKEKLNKRQSR